MAVDLSVECMGLSFQNPVLVASGTFGYGDEYYDIMPFRLLGGLVTKTITARVRPGNPPPRVVETDAGMLNSIGLANVGLEAFLRDKLPWILQHAGPSRIVVNFAGFSVDEYLELGAVLGRTPGIDALEVNLGCPNVRAGHIHFGADPEGVRQVISGVRGKTALPIVAKLTPNVTDIASLAQNAVEAGADCVSLINTLPGMKIDVQRRKPVLGMGFGGLSGPAIRPVGVACVYKVYQRLRQIGSKAAIIGIGGITSGCDALEYILAGARLVQVGTASFVHPQAAKTVVDELERYCAERNIESISELIGAAHEE
ncbi:MAG TPA: dihydroorotate dehydrogenase [archaeon]|nr:dihydroorotate dehydrogenase [archaeon]